MYLYSKEEHFQKDFKQYVLKSCLFCCDLSLAPFLSYVTDTSEDLATLVPRAATTALVPLNLGPHPRPVGLDSAF